MEVLFKEDLSTEVTFEERREEMSLARGGRGIVPERGAAASKA